MNNLKRQLIKFINLFIPKEEDFHEFKPILAEIEDRPMNPIGPTVFWLVILFMFIAILWLYFGKVDVVVTARGIVIPAGEEKLVETRSSEPRPVSPTPNISCCALEIPVQKHKESQL